MASDRGGADGARPGFGEAGQASVELIACIPAFLIAGLVSLQLLVAGYSVTLVDNAAEAGALALAADHSPGDAVRAALPGWARDRVQVAVRGGRVEVSVRPPSPLAAVADRLEVSSSAWAEVKR